MNKKFVFISPIFIFTNQTVGFMNTTKKHIILTSFRLFLQNGFKDVTMQVLVKAAGLSKGAFYHYFENKEQLFNETINSLFFSISPFYHEVEVDPQQSFYEYVCQYIDNVEKMSAKIRDYMGSSALPLGYYRLMMDVANYVPGFKEKIEKANMHELNFWNKIIDNGIKNGELKSNLDRDILANHFKWLDDGLALNSFFTGNIDFLSEKLEKTLMNFYQLIKKE